MIHILLGGRGSGKTHKIIEAMRADPNIILVCHSEIVANMRRKQYPDLAIRILAPNPEHLRGLDTSFRVVVDNAELLLAQVLGKPIYGATMTAIGSTLDV